MDERRDDVTDEPGSGPAAGACRTVEAAVVLTLPMPGMRPETLRVRCCGRSVTVSAVGRTTLAAFEDLPACYEHDIDLDRRIDGTRVRAELDGPDGVRLVLPLRPGR